MNNLSVIKSAKNLHSTKMNNRNHYPSDEFLGLSAEEKLSRLIFNAPVNIETGSEEKPESDLHGVMTEHSEIKLTDSNNITGETENAEKETTESAYQHKKIQRKKKYSAMARQDMADFEDFIVMNENFHCVYSSVRNSLLRSR